MVEISKKKIIELEMLDVLSELSVVNDRIRLLKSKYSLSFEELQQEENNSQEENFQRYDDLLIWEGYLSSKSFLEKRLEELENAEDIIITE